MIIEYKDMEKVEQTISDWLKGKFLKERILFGDMATLMLESFKPLEGHSESTSNYKLALLALSSRMFNDCEGAKQLLLWGLPDQSQPLIRDIIECIQLLRLFLKKPRYAERWLINLNEYQPSDVNAQLKKLHIEAREYAFYGSLSHGVHSNLLGSLSPLQEREAGDHGMLRIAHFGTARTPEAEFSIQENFIIMFFLMHVALVGPLAKFYYSHIDSETYDTWAKKMENLTPRLVDITSEMIKQEEDSSNSVDPILQDLVFKKMRFESLQKRLEKE
ncbi:MAG: hypothetical protein D4R82_00640 [Dehalococcoidia bacterium]|nr:MAG: hypothetical protein D4R82_00640 [Dehalococcoidia bacterium]